MQELGETHEQRRDTDHYYDIRSGSEGHSESDEEDSRTPQTQAAPAAPTEERQATTTSTTAPAAPAVSTEERRAAAATILPLSVEERRAAAATILPLSTEERRAAAAAILPDEPPRAPQSQAQQGAVPRRPAPPRTATPARRGRATEERTHRPPVPTQGSGIILPPRPAVCEPQSWTDPPTIYDNAMYPPSLATRVIIQGCVKCGCAKHGGRYCPIQSGHSQMRLLHPQPALRPLLSASAVSVPYLLVPRTREQREVPRKQGRPEGLPALRTFRRLRGEEQAPHGARLLGLRLLVDPHRSRLQELPVHEGQGDGHCWRSSRDPAGNPDLCGVRNDVVGSETRRTAASWPGPSPKSQRAYLHAFGSRTGRLGRHDGTLHLQASQRPRASQRRRATAATSASASAAGSAVRPHVQGRGMVD
ncbi:unnamed protein product [Sphagnum tenellum]